jgi:Mg2+/Co2+ transporter CorB
LAGTRLLIILNGHTLFDALAGFVSGLIIGHNIINILLADLDILIGILGLGNLGQDFIITIQPIAFYSLVVIGLAPGQHNAVLGNR